MVIAIEELITEWNLQFHSGYKTYKHAVNNKRQYMLKIVKKKKKVNQGQ